MKVDKIPEEVSFEHALGYLDRVRCYRLGVCDIIDKLVKEHERKYGKGNLWPEGVKGYKKHNREQRLKSEGYLEAYRDVVAVLSDANTIQNDWLLRFSEWAEKELEGNGSYE